MTNKICVYAICKNEINYIDKWLDNVSEADYIVVLDTGSTDGSFEKLKADKRVTRVEQKVISPWRFDVARNESMKLIPEDANILVSTDFDELFTKGWATQVRGNWRENTNRMYYKYAWSHNEVGEPTDVFLYDKIHTRDYEWIYPVHEVLKPKQEGFKQNIIDLSSINIMLHHFQDKSKQRGSYFDLLKLSTEENPHDCHVQMLFAREYFLKKDYANALIEYKKTLSMPEIENKDFRLIKLESLGRIAQLDLILKNYEESMAYCYEFIKNDKTYREPYFMLGQIYSQMKLYPLAKAVVEAGIKYSTRKYDWIERADTWISEASSILCVAEYYLGNTDEAIKQCSEFLNHHPDDVQSLKNMAIFLNSKLNETQEKLNKLDKKDLK